MRLTEAGSNDPHLYYTVRCHGLGIVDTNELNSYLDYCSHRREYRI